MFPPEGGKSEGHREAAASSFHIFLASTMGGGMAFIGGGDHGVV